MDKDKSHGATQFAALPWRVDEDGLRQIMLITSRETHRWVIPKGWPMKGLKPPKVAAREAFEEAGVVGHIIGKRPIGSYHYLKRLLADQRLCEVKVFLLRVDRQRDAWPEKGQRDIRWCDPAEAAELVNEDGLAELIRHAFAGNAVAPTLHRPRRTRRGTDYSPNRTRLASKSP